MSHNISNWERKWAGFTLPLPSLSTAYQKSDLTTNAIKTVNRQIRKIIKNKGKIIKNKGVFSNDKAVNIIIPFRRYLV